jgi:hypothetical protein
VTMRRRKTRRLVHFGGEKGDTIIPLMKSIFILRCSAILPPALDMYLAAWSGNFPNVPEYQSSSPLAFALNMILRRGTLLEIKLPRIIKGYSPLLSPWTPTTHRVKNTLEPLLIHD